MIVFVAASSSSQAAPVRVAFEVSEAHRRDLNLLGDAIAEIPVPDFTGTVTFELQTPAESGTDSVGTVYTFWNPSGSLHFETDSPLQALLEGYAGDPEQGLTARTALVAEHISGQASSSVFLRSITMTPVGLLLFEVAGVVGVGDIPGIEADKVRSPTDLIAALELIGTAKFNMTGYGLTTSGGFTNYGLVEGRVTFTSVEPVPVPATVGLLSAALFALPVFGPVRRLRTR